MVSSEQFKQVSIWILISAVVSFFSRNFLTGGYLVGWDSVSHIFKTWFTMECLAGRSAFDWCEYWYTGSPIMPMYGPLFYVLSGLLGASLGTDALTASKWVVFLSFPISSLSFYHFSKRDHTDIASIAGAIVYGLIPWHFTYMTILGNPTYCLCYVFLPPLFKFLEGRTHVHLVLASVSLSLITLSHQGTGFLVAYVLIWYSLFSGIMNKSIRRSFLKLSIVGVITAGLMCFFWIPYVYYGRMTSSFNVPFAPTHESINQLFQEDHFMYIGTTMLIIALISTLGTALSKSKKGIIQALMTGLFLLLTFYYNDPRIKIIYPFYNIIGPGYRFNILSSFTISMLICEFIKNTPNILSNIKSFDIEKKNKIMFLITAFSIITLAASITTISPLSKFENQPIPSSHTLIYSTLSEQQEEGRVWWVPRGALQASIPMFTGLATPDGWYDQAAAPEVYSLIHDLADIQMYENPNYFLGKLKELSVRYLIVPKGSLYESINNLKNVQLLTENSDLALFIVENIDPLQITSIPPLGKTVRYMGIFFSSLFVILLVISRKKIHNVWSIKSLTSQ